MAAPESLDLRERGVEAVARGGMSRNQAARHCGVAISTAISWMKLRRKSGSVAPGQVAGLKPRKIASDHRACLIRRCQSADLTLRGLVAELYERDLKVD